MSDTLSRFAQQPWSSEALCAEDVIYLDGERMSPWEDAFADTFGMRPDAEAEERAKRVCARCKVKSECLLYALENGERHGVWGETTRAERLAMFRTIDEAA